MVKTAKEKEAPKVKLYYSDNVTLALPVDFDPNRSHATLRTVYHQVATLDDVQSFLHLAARRLGDDAELSITDGGLRATKTVVQ